MRLKPLYDITTRHSTLTPLFLQRLNVIINLSTENIHFTHARALVESEAAHVTSRSMILPQWAEKATSQLSSQQQQSMTYMYQPSQGQNQASIKINNPNLLVLFPRVISAFLLCSTQKQYFIEENWGIWPIPMNM